MSDCSHHTSQPKHLKNNTDVSVEPARAAQSARYTEEMLNSLEKIAKSQKQPVLAHLLALAAWEARKITRPD